VFKRVPAATIDSAMSWWLFGLISRNPAASMAGPRFFSIRPHSWLGVPSGFRCSILPVHRARCDHDRPYHGTGANSTVGPRPASRVDNCYYLAEINPSLGDGSRGLPPNLHPRRRAEPGAKSTRYLSSSALVPCPPSHGLIAGRQPTCSAREQRRAVRAGRCTCRPRANATVTGALPASAAGRRARRPSGSFAIAGGTASESIARRRAPARGPRGRRRGCAASRKCGRRAVGAARLGGPRTFVLPERPFRFAPARSPSTLPAVSAAAFRPAVRQDALLRASAGAPATWKPSGAGGCANLACADRGVRRFQSQHVAPRPADAAFVRARLPRPAGRARRPSGGTVVGRGRREYRATASPIRGIRAPRISAGELTWLESTAVSPAGALMQT